MSYRRNAFNVMLDDEDKARLAEIAELTGYSKGQCLRTALANAWMHKCRHAPVCADGRNCYVPQMHGETSVHAHPNTLQTAEAAAQKEA